MIGREDKFDWCSRVKRIASHQVIIRPSILQAFDHRRDLSSVVEVLTKADWDENDLDSLPELVAVTLRRVFHLYSDIQKEPMKHGTPPFFARWLEFKKDSPSGAPQTRPLHLIEAPPQTTRAATKDDRADHDGMEILNSHSTVRRFGGDLRLLEARRLLRSSSPVAIKTSASNSDGEHVPQQQAQLAIQAVRTMALPLGRRRCNITLKMPTSSTLAI
jgi:hypothetical protein